MAGKQFPKQDDLAGKYGFKTSLKPYKFYETLFFQLDLRTVQHV